MSEEHTRAELSAEQTAVQRPVPPEVPGERTTPIFPVPPAGPAPTYARKRPYVTGLGGGDATTTVVSADGKGISDRTSSGVLASDDPLAQPFAFEATTTLAPVKTTQAARAFGKQPSASDARRRSLRTAGVVAASVLGVLGLVYATDLVVSGGAVPRGVVVAGVDIGGLEPAAAEQRLRAQIEPRLGKPIQIRAGDVLSTLDPKAAGLTIDWAATLDQAGAQPWNPWTRLTSFFTTHEVRVATRTDTVKLTSALEALRVQVDRDPVEGAIRFDGATAKPVEPKPGQKLDVPTAVSAVLAGWSTGKEIDVPVRSTPVTTTSEGVHTALDGIAGPAVSGPITVNGDGKDAKVTPQVVAQALTFEPNGRGGLNPKLDQARIVDALAPQLAPTEQQGTDAQIVFQGGAPVVKPAQDGRGVDYDKTLAGLMDVLRNTANRAIKAQYADKPAKVTTDQASQLGIKEVIGEFTTGGFAQDSGVNIHMVADKVNGAIVKPGDTFSLNAFTGPRTAAQGYVEAGVIENGVPGRDVGGGISQFATTLYNASYFAAMTDVVHREHSFYISRYPPAREATVFQGPTGNSLIDIKFKDDAPTGVAIQTIWTPSSLTVRLWGTKHYQVESIPGDKTDFTDPNIITKNPGEVCTPTNGAPGFTTSDTRVIRDLHGREVRRDTHTVRYNPVPKIVCAP